MSLSGYEFYTKNKDMQRYLDILSKEKYVELPAKFAQEFGRNRAVRRYREKNMSKPYVVIAKDKTFNQSIIKIKEPLTIKKLGNRYKFELLL